MTYYMHNTTGKRCYHDHPPLPLGDGLKIYGGSCITPVVKNAHVYIGFDSQMKRTPRRFPWSQGDEVFFPITDRAVPKELGDFQALLKWTEEQLRAGKKVHAGCIGGHGRTGIFFSALVKNMMGIEDATAYVRANYCKKAVESAQQVEWLHTYFGIKKVEPRDGWAVKSKTVPKHTGSPTVRPIKTNYSVWGPWV